MDLRSIEKYVINGTFGPVSSRGARATCGLELATDERGTVEVSASGGYDFGRDDVRPSVTRRLQSQREALILQEKERCACEEHDERDGGYVCVVS